MILFFGNALSKHGMNITMIEPLSQKLREMDDVEIASSVRNTVFRMFHMMWVYFRHVHNTKIVLIDTYSNLAFYYVLVIAGLSRMFNVPYAPILRGGNLGCGLKKSPFLAKMIFGYSKYNVTPSMYLLEQFQKEGYPVKYIPNFIELERYPYIKRHKCSPKLLWVRAFHEVYNPEMAIKVLGELAKEYPNAELCMVGPNKDGSLESCRKLAEDSGVLNNIIFTGQLPKEEWINLSKKYDIFINTTDFESFGLSVLEAAACGLPIVTTNSGELNYLYKDKHDALLVAKNDVFGMLNSIHDILNDSDLAESLSMNARRKAECFDWKAVKVYWENLVHDAEK